MSELSLRPEPAELSEREPGDGDLDREQAASASLGKAGQASRNGASGVAPPRVRRVTISALSTLK